MHGTMRARSPCITPDVKSTHWFQRPLGFLGSVKAEGLEESAYPQGSNKLDGGHEDDPAGGWQVLAHAAHKVLHVDLHLHKHVHHVGQETFLDRDCPTHPYHVEAKKKRAAKGLPAAPNQSNYAVTQKSLPGSS